jgi:hypothetical protein
MSKSFSQVPKPSQLTADVISAFERGGTGQDTRVRIPSIVGNGEPTNVGPSGASRESTDVGRLESTSVETRKATKPEMGETTKVGTVEPTRRLSIDLPESWHRRFKTACTKSDKKMIDEVTNLIKQRTIELEQE